MSEGLNEGYDPGVLRRGGVNQPKWQYLNFYVSAQVLILVVCLWRECIFKELLEERGMEEVNKIANLVVEEKLEGENFETGMTKWLSWSSVTGEGVEVSGGDTTAEDGVADSVTTLVHGNSDADFDYDGNINHIPHHRSYISVIFDAFVMFFSFPNSLIFFKYLLTSSLPFYLLHVIMVSIFLPPLTHSEKGHFQKVILRSALLKLLWAATITQSGHGMSMMDFYRWYVAISYFNGVSILSMVKVRFMRTNGTSDLKSVKFIKALVVVQISAAVLCFYAFFKIVSEAAPGEKPEQATVLLMMLVDIVLILNINMHIWLLAREVEDIHTTNEMTRTFSQEGESERSEEVSEFA